MHGVLQEEKNIMRKLLFSLLLLVLSVPSYAYIFDYEEDMNQGLYLFSGSGGSSVSSTPVVPTPTPSVAPTGCIYFMSEFYQTTYSSGNNVVTINEFSGNGITMVQPTAGYQSVFYTPVSAFNNRGKYEFDGNDNVYQSSSATLNNIAADADGFTVCWVGLPDSVQTDYVFHKCVGTSAGHHLVHVSGGQLQYSIYTDATDGRWTWANAVTVNVLAAWMLTYSGAVSTNVPHLYVNGTEYPRVTVTTPSAVIGNDSSVNFAFFNQRVIPSTSAYNGGIAELRIYDHMLNTANRQYWEDSVNTTYNIW
jgi:hypothetical protein